MKKELCQREEKGVLFTPDLFDVSEIKWAGRSRKRILVSVACAVVFTVIVVIFAVSFFGKSSGVEQGGISGDENGQNGVMIPGTETERESIRYTETEGGGKGEESESTARNETESITEAESEEKNEEQPSCIIKDLSEKYRGEGFVINFTEEKVDISSLLDRGFVDSETAGNKAPTVMIIHTHTTEEYKKGSDYFRGPVSVVSVGEAITDELNRAGLGTLHCTVIHDSGNRNAYLEAKDTIQTMLEIYPSIKYVIDIHRMVISEAGVPIKTLSASGAAQVRLSVSAESSEIGDWHESLSLALSIRHEMNKEDGICMPIVITGGGYNSNLSVYHLVAEVGTDQNSVEEAILAGRAFARAIAETVLE